MKINKLCLYFLIVLAGVIMPKVHALGSLNNEIDLEYGNTTYAYNWSSSTSWSALNLNRASLDAPYYTPYVTTGTYGISFGQFLNGILLPKHYYRITWVAENGGGTNCGTPNSWANQLRTGTAMGNSGQVTRTYFNFIGIQNNQQIFYSDGSVSTGACAYTIVTAFAGNVSWINFPVNSSASLNQEWFYYGYYIEDIGSTDTVSNSELQTAITNMQNSINSNSNTNTQNIINNQNTNTQNIINNQNTNANQAHNDAVNTQNTIKDDSVDNPNSSITTIKNSLATNGVITSLVVLPVTLYQAILNSVNGTCSTFSLGSLFGTNLTIPCINVANYLGTTLWGSIDVIISGFFIYMISRKMVKVFNQLSSLKEGDVLDG